MNAENNVVFMPHRDIAHLLSAISTLKHYLQKSKDDRSAAVRRCVQREISKVRFHLDNVAAGQFDTPAPIYHPHLLDKPDIGSSMGAIAPSIIELVSLVASCDAKYDGSLAIPGGTDAAIRALGLARGIVEILEEAA